MSSQTICPTETTIRFGPSNSAGKGRFEFELDVERLEIRHQGKPVNLRPQAIQALVVLLQHEGRLVTNEEFCRVLWGGQYIGWRNSLHQCIRDLRRALADNARNPLLVATVTRLGYRFVGEQMLAVEPDLAQEVSGRLGWHTHSFRRPSVAFFAGFAAAVVLLPTLFIVVCVVLAA